MCNSNNKKMDQERWGDRQLEVYLTTYDGAQHLKLHGWLKRNAIPIRSESILDEEDCFGVFTVIIDDVALANLKEANLKKGLFCDLETMGMGSKSIARNLDLDEDIIKNIHDVMENLTFTDKGDIEKFLKQANETSLALFKRNDDFVNDYVETTEMTTDDKLKDLEIMIDNFCEDERYEDCAILVKIKEKVIKYEKTLNRKGLS